MSVKKHENAGSGCSGACCLKVADLSVSLGEQTVLEHVSFHLHCGEITALIGPNGAGKSTLFRTILGQLPHAGTIDFQQAGGRRTRPLIGYVPQSPSFDRGDPVSVLDLFVSAIDAWPVFLPAPKKVRARVAACLKRVHAESLIDTRLGSLSGGELQRVLLAMALEPVPHILILDEPLSGVDIEGKSSFWTCWTRCGGLTTCPSSCPPTTLPPWRNMPTRSSCSRASAEGGHAGGGPLLPGIPGGLPPLAGKGAGLIWRCGTPWWTCCPSTGPSPEACSL